MSRSYMGQDGVVVTLPSTEELLLALRAPLMKLDQCDWRALGFDMTYWADGDEPPKTPQLGCGTATCAFGVGTTLPSWQAAGLTLVRGVSRWLPVADAPDRLGLTTADWRYIFVPDSYLNELLDDSSDEISPWKVVQHIDEVLVKRRK